MKLQKHNYLAIDTLILAAAGIWLVSIVINLLL